MDQYLVHKKQVAPLPVGPGGANAVKRQLNETNSALTMLHAQSSANTKYDPPVPQQITPQKMIESFTDYSGPKIFAVIGGLCIVYGLIAK